MPPQIPNQNNSTITPTNTPANSSIKITHGHTFLITLTTLLLLTGVFGVWYFLNPAPELEPEHLATKTDEFADWKTYKNEEYGESSFEFKYPSDWYSSHQTRYAWAFQSAPFENNIHGIGLPPQGNMWVNVTNVEICDGIVSFTVFEFKPNISEKTVCLHNDKNNFEITLGLWQADSNLTEHQELLNKILSTFKFISTSTPNVSNSGISGTVTIGPTCPVERVPPDPKCADKPYQTKLRIVNEGDTVEFTASDINGKFSIDLNPGTYHITVPDLSKQMPSLPKTQVIVAENKYTQVNLQFDSGIR